MTPTVEEIKTKITLGTPNPKKEAEQDNRETIRDIHVVTQDGAWPVIRCVLTMGRSSSASRVYASVWFFQSYQYDYRDPEASPERFASPRNNPPSGRGWAGGYGYNKESAAVDAALTASGIVGVRFSGQGMMVAERYLLATAELWSGKPCRLIG